MNGSDEILWFPLCKKKKKKERRKKKKKKRTRLLLSTYCNTKTILGLFRERDTTAFPKLSFWAPQRRGDAAVGRGINAGYILSKSEYPCRARIAHDGFFAGKKKKDRKEISAESSLMSLRRPDRLKDWPYLTWLARIRSCSILIIIPWHSFDFSVLYFQKKCNIDDSRRTVLLGVSKLYKDGQNVQNKKYSGGRLTHFYRHCV